MTQFSTTISRVKPALVARNTKAALAHLLPGRSFADRILGPQLPTHLTFGTESVSYRILRLLQMSRRRRPVGDRLERLPAGRCRCRRNPNRRREVPSAGRVVRGEQRQQDVLAVLPFEHVGERASEPVFTSRSARALSARYRFRRSATRPD